MTPPSPQPTGSKTPLTDAEVESVSHKFQNLYPHLRDKAVRADFARSLELKLNDANEKLAFLKSKGMSVGKMKTSDKPEPYLVYVVEPDSELDDTRLVRELIDTEIERGQLRKVCEKLSERLEITNGAWVNELGCYPLPLGSKRHIRDHLQANEAAIAEYFHVIAEKKGTK
jgi:hypothetical protein